MQEAIKNNPIGNSKLTRSMSFTSANDIYNRIDSTDESLGFLVPDYRYRSILNKNMEIIVGDTIYKVTSQGTLYANKLHKEEFDESIDNIQNFKRISDNTMQLGNVFLKNTFSTWDSNDPNPITDENYFEDDDFDVELPETMMTRSNTLLGGISINDVENFPEVGSVKVNILDKIMRFSPGYLNHTKIRFKSNRHRKLYVSLYKYDYGFAVSIGIDCKVMKKLWHGMSWGRMKHWGDGIYYGLSGLIIKQEIKQPVYDDFMKFNKQQLNNLWEYNRKNDANNRMNYGLANEWTPEYNYNKKYDYNIPCVGDAVNEFLGDSKDSKRITKRLDKFLVSKGMHYMEKLDTSKPSQKIDLFSDQDCSIYHYFRNDLTWNKGGYRIKDTFFKYYKSIVLSIKIKGSNTLKPGIHLDDNAFFGSPEIYFCEGLVYTKDGDGWIGAKIIQEPEE